MFNTIVFFPFVFVVVAGSVDFNIVVVYDYFIVKPKHTDGQTDSLQGTSYRIK